MYQQLKFDPDVESAFSPRQLIVVATLTKTSGGLLPSQENIPSGFLFSEKTYAETSGGYHLLTDGVVTHFVEFSTGDGCKYRVYDATDKANATVTYCLAVGDVNADVCDIDLRLSVVKNNGNYEIHNDSLINGQHWTNVNTNREMTSYGFQYTISGVGNGEYGQLKYLPNGGYQQTGTKVPFVTIGTSGVVDHTVLQSDIDDANVESIGLQFVWRPRGGSWKNASSVLKVQLNEFMEEYAQ